MSRGREEPVRRGQRHRKPKHRKRGSREGERRGGRGMKRRRQQAEGVERLSIQWLHNRAFVFHHHEQLTYVSKRHVPHEGSLTSSKKLYAIYRRRFWRDLTSSFCSDAGGRGQARTQDRRGPL